MKSDPRYLKDVTIGSSASTKFTVVSVSFVGLGKYGKVAYMYCIIAYNIETGRFLENE